MAFNVGSIEATLELNGQNFIGTLRDASNATDEFSDRTREAGEGSEILTGALRRIGEGLVELAASLVSTGIDTLVEGFKRAVEESEEFEADVRKLDVALNLRGIGGFSENLQGLADELQNTTQFSRNSTVEVEKFLAIAGVRSKDLERFTRIVLDFAAATGVSAANAAQQFSRTLSGGIGRSIAQYLPSVLNLTKEQRKAGEVFLFAEKQLGGFAEALGTTAEVIDEQFHNAVKEAFSNLGFALQPIVNTFFKLGKQVADAIGAGIKENESGITKFFAGLAESATVFLVKVIDFLIDMPVHIARVKAAFGNLKAGIILAFAEARVKVDEFFLSLAKKQATIVGSFAGQTLLGFSKADSEAAVIQVGKAAIALAQAKAAAGGLRENLATTATEGQALVSAAQESADAIRSGENTSSTFAKTMGVIRDAAQGAAEHFHGLANGAKDVDNSLDKIGGTSGILTRQLEVYRRLAEGLPKTFEETAEEAEGVGDALQDGVKSTQELNQTVGETLVSFGSWADEIHAAGDELDRVNSKAGGGGGGGGGGGEPFGTGIGGKTFSASLATDTAAGTASTLSLFRRRAAFGSAESRLITQPLIEQLASLLKQQLAEETKQFATGVIDALNQQGIFDPVQRQQIIQQRFDEARRLGIITSVSRI